MVDEITRRRWDKVANASKVEAKTALQILLADIEDGTVNPHHIVIVYLDRCEKGDSVSVTQSGPCTTLEVQGMLSRANSIMNP